MSNIKYSTAV